MRLRSICAVACLTFGLAPTGEAALESPLILHTDGASIDPLVPFYDVDAHADWSPDEYDGAVFTQDAPDLTSLPTVHAVYIVGWDAPNRFTELAAMFQADARQASERQHELYGRHIRFDERLGTDGRRYVDITVVVSQYTTGQLSLPYVQFGLVRSELRRVGLTDPDKKYAVWLDGPSFACGQAELHRDTRRSPANGNERSTIAIVYRNYARSPGGGMGDVDGGGFCRGRTLHHELGHAFGAVQRPAPNNFDGAHCDDSAEDVMCYKGPALEDTGGPVFDYGNDDYWDPAANPLGSSRKLGWWTVNLSRFICPRAGCHLPNTHAY